MEAGVTHHPIGLIVTDDLRRSRLTVFFRLLLVIPHVIWLYIWGIAVGFAVLFAWFAALFTGRVPQGLHDFNAGFLRYSTRVTGYVFLLADPWPPFSARGSVPDRRSRRPAADAEQADRLLPHHPRDPGALPRLRVPPREPGRCRARLVLLPRSRPDERGHAQHQRVAAPLRGADLRVPDAADRRRYPSLAGAPTA